MYPTTSELVAASSVTALTSKTPEQQGALRAEAIAAIEAHTGQVFESFSGTLSVASEGGATLMLPRRLRTLTEARTQRGTALEAAAIEVGPKEDRLVWKSDVVGVGTYEQALYEVSGGDYPKKFPRGYVAVEGEWGWVDPPSPVVQAIRYDMEDAALADENALTETVHVYRKLGIQNISQGNLRAELAVAPTLSPRVTRLLEPYVWFGQGGYLV